MDELWQVAGGAALSLLILWGGLVVFLALAHPRRSLTEGLRLLPDVLRLVRRLASDSSLPRGVRIHLFLLLLYLALPIDLIPDFLPLVGHLDDVILVCLVLRSVVRRAGPATVRKHWPGTESGLAVLWQLADLGQVERERDEQEEGLDRPS